MTTTNRINSNFYQIAVTDANGNVTGVEINGSANITGNVSTRAITTTGNINVGSLASPYNITSFGPINAGSGFIERIQTINGGTILAPNINLGGVIKFTPTSNFTFNSFTLPTNGMWATVIITQGAIGYSMASTMKFAGGNKTLSGINRTDIIRVFYDSGLYYAWLDNQFA